MATQKKTAPKAEAVKAEAVKVEKTVKAPAKRAAAPKVTLYVEYQDKQVAQEELVEAVKAAYTEAPIKTMELYLKLEDGAVYYVINGDVSGKVEI